MVATFAQSTAFRLRFHATVCSRIKEAQGIHPHGRRGLRLRIFQHRCQRIHPAGTAAAHVVFPSAAEVGIIGFSLNIQAVLQIAVHRHGRRQQVAQIMQQMGRDRRLHPHFASAAGNQGQHHH